MHVLKQHEKLLSLLNEPKVLNPVSEKYTLFRYKLKNSFSNLPEISYIQECVNFKRWSGYY